MTRFPLILALGLGLSACAGKPKPAIDIKFVEVVVEVQKPCPGEKPVRPAPLARPLPSDLGQLAATLAKKLAEYSDPGNYADQADAFVDRCLTLPED